MGCDICGTDSSPCKVSIEGVEMQTCVKCSGLGKRIDAPAQPFQQRTSAMRREPLLTVVASFPSRIRQAREKSGLDQKQFAARIKESESTLRHLEAGALHPSIEQAQRFEKMLGLKLVIKESSGALEKQEKKDETMTLGDIIKIKK